MVLSRCPLCPREKNYRVWQKGSYEYHYCEVCLLYFVFPRPTLDEISALYTDDYYQDYQDQQHREEDYDTHFRKLERFLKPANLLEVGCGTGGLLSRFAKAGWSVTGIEPSSYAARFARDKRSLHVIEGELKESDLLPSSFDQIIIWDVIAHVLEPKDLVSQCRILLKDGGALIIRTPLRHPFDFMLERAISLASPSSGFIVHYPYQLNHFTSKGLRGFLIQEGFEVSDYYFGKRIAPLHLNRLSLKGKIAQGITTLSDWVKRGRDSIVLIARETSLGI